MPEFRISEKEQLDHLKRLEENQEDELLPQYFRARMVGFNWNKKVESYRAPNGDRVYYQ